jgi:DNA-binding MarR family transcriptional regulator
MTASGVSDARLAALSQALADELISVRLVYTAFVIDGPATAADLVADLGVSHPTVYRARDTLLKHDLIAVVSHPEDGRRRYYQLRE